ncbi:MAG: ROK family protein [Anaerolineae bacterium]|nr:ROK family protein [Anaerolineae bacterium]
MAVLGIDIGGSGIKGALVDVEKGVLLTERTRLPTPPGAKPEDVTGVVKQLVQLFQWQGVIGVGFPAVIRNGVVMTAANIHPSWIGVNAEQLFRDVTGNAVHAINDADAAGIAEMEFGAGKGYKKGVVVLLTIGTGIGSAIFVDGTLLPNSEFGHLQIRGKDAEKRASGAARQKKNLSWEDWSKRLQELLSEMEKLLAPDVFILGGGVSKQADRFFPYLKTNARLISAQFLNQAGIIGAAIYADKKISTAGGNA